MTISTEAIKQDLDLLSDEQLQQIVDFIAFLRFRDKRRRMILDPQQLASLATEFAQEDSALAEEEVDDYRAMLAQEDHRTYALTGN